MYNKVAKDLNFPAREKEIAQLWKDKDIVRRSFHFRDGAKRLTFFDGPPTANGRPHIGHIETRVIKDLIPRYWTMKGYSVLRKAGWIPTVCPLSWKSKRRWVWTASRRLNSTASSRSSRNARSPSGSTCMTGRS